MGFLNVRVEIYQGRKRHRAAIMIAEVGFFSRVGADVRLEVPLLIKGGPASLETERADEFTNSGVFFLVNLQSLKYAE